MFSNLGHFFQDCSSLCFLVCRRIFVHVCLYKVDLPLEVLSELSSLFNTNLFFGSFPCLLTKGVTRGFVVRGLYSDLDLQLHCNQRMQKVLSPLFQHRHNQQSVAGVCLYVLNLCNYFCF